MASGWGRSFATKKLEIDVNPQLWQSKLLIEGDCRQVLCCYGLRDIIRYGRRSARSSDDCDDYITGKYPVSTKLLVFCGTNKAPFAPLETVEYRIINTEHCDSFVNKLGMAEVTAKGPSPHCARSV